MVGRKPVRTRGKLQLSRCFQELKEGDFVAVSREPAIPYDLPTRLQGRTGIVTGKRGRAYIVKIREGGMEKQRILLPIHLKKIKQVKTK